LRVSLFSNHIGAPTDFKLKVSICRELQEELTETTETLGQDSGSVGQDLKLESCELKVRILTIQL
jgi:hypothetical protein